MVEVFTTNIQLQIQADQVLSILKQSFPELKVSFDINDSELPFPCGHSILRVEGEPVNPEEILSMMNKTGYQCDILEDKVCK